MKKEQHSQPKSFKIVIASKNVHKIRETREMLSAIPHLDIWSLLDFPGYSPPEERGKSFEENASLKAIDAAKQLKIWAIGDDSGLVVPALNGEPGIFSSRYAGKNASDKENRKKLLQEMSPLLDEDRSAYYISAVALASPEGSLKKCAIATCEGRILEIEKGGGGFGFDPLFVKNEYSKTFAELEERIKNHISHRRKALDKIIPLLESILE